MPAQLQWRGLEQAAATRGATRGFLGDVLLSAIEVVTGVGKGGAADFVVKKAVERVDDQVDAGLYALAPESLPPLKGTGTPLVQVPAAPDGGPLLVFVHGTFSTTSGSFGKLWSLHPQHVRALFAKYAGRVYGLEHPTLGVSPIDNALTLARAMPQGRAPASRHPFARRTGRRGAGARVREPAAERAKTLRSSKATSTWRSATR